MASESREAGWGWDWDCEGTGGCGSDGWAVLGAKAPGGGDGESSPEESEGPSTCGIRGVACVVCVSGG